MKEMILAFIGKAKDFSVENFQVNGNCKMKGE